MALIQTGPDESAALPPEQSELADIGDVAPTNGPHGHRNGHNGSENGHVWIDVGRPTASGSPAHRVLVGDARKLPIEDDTVDLIATSPPYWQKRDYGVESQIGQESTPKGYVDAMIECLREWRRVLRPTGSIFFNIGDTFHKRMLAAIPARVEAAAGDDGWIIRNRIIWAKDGGMPEPAQNRLANRHEYILHLVARHDYYYDLFGYSRAIGNGANPGDVWRINPERNMGDHLAPFPTEIVRRAALLACPYVVCSRCGVPRQRIVERTAELDPSRPQAKRAMELAAAAGLTPDHIAAIQATGVSDAGKALRTQNGTGRNAASVKALAAEAKEALGGYFREFTFAQRRSVGWTRCDCRAKWTRGVILDPFMGTGTTLATALASYQYEDFMQGFVPKLDGDGFVFRDKYFVEMCRACQESPDKHFVLVIDELSRGDPGRVFGEALTYVERSKRGLPFNLASGQSLIVPGNLIVLATMNPLDRGVDEVDAAFERRFAKIAMDPDRDVLDKRLEQNGVDDYTRRGILNFFSQANSYAEQTPQGASGHTFFWNVTDQATLRSVWEHQLRFLVEKAYRLDPETREGLESAFERLLGPPPETDELDEIAAAGGDVDVGSP